MTNDIIKFNDKQYQVSFKAARIDFPEYQDMKKQIDLLHDQFMKWKVTPDNLKSSKNTRAKLNRLKKAINDRKIEIVRQADQPIQEFQRKIKGLNQEIVETSTNIGKQIQAYEDKAKQDRHNQNLKNIAKMCKEAGLTSDDILNAGDGYNSKWDNKSFSYAQFEKEVAEKIKTAQQIKEQLKINQKVVIDKADQLGLPVGHWLDVLQNKPLDQVLKKMGNYKQELVDIAHRQEKAKKKQKQETTTTGDKVINYKTGEVVDKVYTVQLEITATKDQLTRLASFIKDWGIIAKRVK